MATIKFRPSSVTSDYNITNIQSMYDDNSSSYSRVFVRLDNNKLLNIEFNFSLQGLFSASNITSAVIYVDCKAPSGDIRLAPIIGTTNTHGAIAISTSRTKIDIPVTTYIKELISGATLAFDITSSNSIAMEVDIFDIYMIVEYEAPESESSKLPETTFEILPISVHSYSGISFAANAMDGLSTTYTRIYTNNTNNKFAYFVFPSIKEILIGKGINVDDVEICSMEIMLQGYAEDGYGASCIGPHLTIYPIDGSSYSLEKKIIEESTSQSSMTTITKDFTDIAQKNSDMFINEGFHAKFEPWSTSSSYNYYRLVDIFLKFTVKSRNNLIRVGHNEIKTILLGTKNIEEVYLGETLIFRGDGLTTDIVVPEDTGDIGTVHTPTTTMALDNIHWNNGTSTRHLHYASTKYRYPIDQLLPDSSSSVIKVEYTINTSEYEHLLSGDHYITLWSETGHDAFIDYFDIQAEVKQYLDVTEPNKVTYYLSMSDLRAIDSTAMNLSTNLAYITFGIHFDLDSGFQGLSAMPVDLITLKVTKQQSGVN